MRFLPGRLVPLALAAACVPNVGPSPAVPERGPGSAVSNDPPPAAAARRPDAGVVVVPARYDAGARYPVLVMLPASNGTAEAMLRAYPAPGDVLIVLAAGTGSGADYRTNEIWARTIERYERQLHADLAALAASGRADTARVVLAGFSMGGDLAWALALRNPTLVRGAVVMGSRMSYPGQQRDIAALALKGARFAVIMGADEEGTRLAGARAATRLLASWDLPYVYREVPGLAHLRPGADVFAEALAFVLGASPD